MHKSFIIIGNYDYEIQAVKNRGKTDIIAWKTGNDKEMYDIKRNVNFKDFIKFILNIYNNADADADADADANKYTCFTVRSAKYNNLDSNEKIYDGYPVIIYKKSPDKAIVHMIKNKKHYENECSISPICVFNTICTLIGELCL